MAHPGRATERRSSASPSTCATEPGNAASSPWPTTSALAPATRRNEAEFALSERKRRCADLKEAAHRREHPQEISNRNESATRQQVADIRDRAANQEKEIAELEATRANVTNEIAATEKAAENLRERLLVP